MNIASQLAVIPILLGTCLLAMPVQARPLTIPATMAFDPPGSGAPPETHGAGSRASGLCPTQAQPFRSLMPIEQGVTLSPRPTILLAVPDDTTVRQAVLTFRDQSDRLHSQVTLPLVVKEGKVRLQLPNSVAPLAVGQSYRWSVVLICSDTLQPDDPIVDGWLQYLPKKLKMTP
jgi:hypothetical protein